MASTGFLYPASARQISPGGGTAWTNPGNATADDGVFATITLANFGSSDYLMGYNFGASIPAGSTITGIQARIKGKTSAASSSLILSMQFVFNAPSYTGSGSDPCSTGNSTSTTLTTTNANLTVGETTGGYPTWGQMDSDGDGTADRAFVLSDFASNSNWGVNLTISNLSGSSKTVSIDSFSVNITYTPGAGGTSVPNQLMLMGVGT